MNQQNTNQRNMKKQKMSGFSIIEVMIAIALSIVLLGAVIEVFYANHQTSIQINGLSRLQENGRFASEFLARKIRMIGYSGCMSYAEIFPYTSLDTLGPVPDLGTHIIGFQATGATWASSNATTLASLIGAGVATAGTDAITITTLNSDTGVRVSKVPGASPGGPAGACPTGAAAALQLTPTTAFKNDDILVVSDCKTSSMFQATNVTSNSTKANIVHNTGGSSRNYTKCLCDVSTQGGTGCDYLGDGFVSKVEQTTYYIARSIRTGTTVNTNNKGATTLSLWRKINTDAAEELVEGVENFQVLYGIDTTPAGDLDSVVDTYVTGDNLPSDTGLVRTIRFSLTTNSVDSVTKGSAASGTAQLIKRTFTQTVVLRNQMFNPT